MIFKPSNSTPYWKLGSHNKVINFQICMYVEYESERRMEFMYIRYTWKIPHAIIGNCNTLTALISHLHQPDPVTPHPQQKEKKLFAIT